MTTTAIPKSVSDFLQRITDLCGTEHADWAENFNACFADTLTTTVKRHDDGTTFLLTGDIPAMWLRDSTAQLRPYLALAAKDDDIANLIAGLVRQQFRYITIDPYANAFNEEPNGASWDKDDQSDFSSPWLWERKYEVDSLCAPLYLAHQYYEATGDKSIFTEEFRLMIHRIADTFSTEQRHERSPYWFVREQCPPSDTLPMAGHGRPVNVTGMTWSGFRPSDDACKFGYLIPSNMMAVVALGYAVELLQAGYEDKVLEERCRGLAADIQDGIETYGVCDHPKYGKIYAYETDGFGNYNLMDDANSPSLLSIPYLGYKPAEDPIYQNTRRFVLSPDNPYYYVGQAAQGIGSPHTPPRYIWHIGLVMQILTSTDEAEKQQCLEMLSRTHAGTNFMHEGFDADDPTKFTRPWFAWANTLFAQMLEKEVGLS